MDKNEPAKTNARTRRCALSREEKPLEELVRFVANDCGEIFPDVSARAPGRGVWISATKDALEQAIKVNAFARSLKRQCYPKSELVAQTSEGLRQKALGLLGLARRSGNIVSGFDKVCDELRKTAPAFIIEAYDGSDDGRDKIIGLSKKWGQVQIIGCFCRDDLGKALSRDNIIHALMPKGQFAQNWAVELNRLRGFMPLRPENWFF
jgi:uncharacterized protein